MTTTLSSRHINLILNGHRFTGYAEDDPPVEFPDMDLVETVTGRDGAMYANDTAMLGGDVTVKLLPTSESSKQVLRWLAQRQRGERLEFEGEYGDTALGYDVVLRGGVMKTCAPATVPGKTFEVVFAFEELIPNYDGARFAAAPQTR